MNLNSSVNKVGKLVTQVIHFSHGNKRTIHHIIPQSIKQGEFTKMKTKEGYMVMINTKNVDLIEVFEER